ncbi:hypothetical protein [Pseudomonas sp. Fl4BN1]|uniref:hypothetical protein n=1 Tax=Pseudomonas sp. Fl4BN1 TaxID=2697651 RepID=UPI003556E536
MWSSEQLAEGVVGVVAAVGVFDAQQFAVGLAGQAGGAFQGILDADQMQAFVVSVLAAVAGAVLVLFELAEVHLRLGAE